MGGTEGPPPREGSAGWHGHESLGPGDSSWVRRIAGLDAGWRPGEVAPCESELLPPGCLAAALPAALMGLRQASLWPRQAMLLAGPAMGARGQRHTGLRRGPGQGGDTTQGRKDPTPPGESSEVFLEAPRDSGCSPLPPGWG